MVRRISSRSRPKYWHPRTSSDREDLRREVERCLESDGPSEISQPLPPVNPFGERWDALPDAKRRGLALLAEDYHRVEDFFDRYLATYADLGAFGQPAPHSLTRNLHR